MARKKDNRDNAELSPIEKLEARREELEARLARASKKARGEMGDLGFWAVVGGAALAADWMILGGIGTGLALLSGATWFGESREAKGIKKQIAKIDEQLAVLELEKMRLDASKPQPAPKAPQPGLTEEFSPAAKKEIDALRERLAEMEKKVEQQADPTLEKPKFGAPKR